MPEVGLRSTWTLSLSTEEVRLVLKALGGRLTCEEAPAAVELGDRLTVQRATATKTAMRQAEEVLSSVRSG